LEWESKERAASSVQKSLPGYGSAAIMMGQTVSVQMSHKEKVALQCAASILGGGMTGRLMHTIREQRGLGTYGIYATMQTVSPSTDHIICIQGTFSPSSLKEGVETTKELVQEWQAHGVTPNELANAKERMVGSRIIAIDEVDQLGSMVLKCVLEEKDPITEFKNFKDTVESLTLADVNNTLLKYVDPTKFTEVIIGTV
jgi:predicted Zn-dependent peptidase